MTRHAKIGIIINNLGTPEKPDYRAVRRYLNEFLSDQRVIEAPKWLWWWILNGFILPFRSAKSALLYQAIWTDNGSPLKVYTASQADGLRAAFLSNGIDNVEVAYAMRYGQPSIAQVTKQLIESGCDRLLLLPLYPQYAASSTATSMDALWSELMRQRNVPAVRTVKDFHDNDLYISSVVSTVESYWQEHGRGDCLVMSFHGLPQSSCDLGDPYYTQCMQSGQFIAERLGLSSEQYRISFQSRFGPKKWLEPYTIDTVEALGASGVARVDVVCPGFVADCLETLEEIAFQVRDSFLSAGGADFHYIPALNSRDEWINALFEICRENMQGWI